MRQPLQARHVLYVESDPALRVSTASRLRAQYPFLQSASSMHEAHHLAGSWPWWCGFIVSADLVDGDGLELLERLCASFGLVPNLLLDDHPPAGSLRARDDVRCVERPLTASDLDAFLYEMARLGHGSETAMVAILAEGIGLTAREAQILSGALVDNLTYGQIADELGVSSSTVRGHVQMIKVKAGGVTMRQLRRSWRRWLRAARPVSPSWEGLLSL